MGVAGDRPLALAGPRGWAGSAGGARRPPRLPAAGAGGQAADGRSAARGVPLAAQGPGADRTSPRRRRRRSPSGRRSTRPACRPSGSRATGSGTPAARITSGSRAPGASRRRAGSGSTATGSATTRAGIASPASGASARPTGSTTARTARRRTVPTRSPASPRGTIVSTSRASIYPDGDGVVWKKGFWAKVQPGWSWVPAQWVRQPDGWVFQDGYWDRTLEDRGTLFAPAEVNKSAQTADNLTYQPYTTVSPELYGQLNGAFGRPNTNYDGYPGVFYDENGRYYGYADYGNLGAYYGYLDYPATGGIRLSLLCHSRAVRWHGLRLWLRWLWWRLWWLWRRLRRLRRLWWLRRRLRWLGYGGYGGWATAGSATVGFGGWVTAGSATVVFGGLRIRLRLSAWATTVFGGFGFGYGFPSASASGSASAIRSSAASDLAASASTAVSALAVSDLAGFGFGRGWSRGWGRGWGRYAFANRNVSVNRSASVDAQQDRHEEWELRDATASVTRMRASTGPSSSSRGGGSPASSHAYGNPFSSQRQSSAARTATPADRRRPGPPGLGRLVGIDRLRRTSIRGRIARRPAMPDPPRARRGWPRRQGGAGGAGTAAYRRRRRPGHGERRRRRAADRRGLGGAGGAGRGAGMGGAGMGGGQSPGMAGGGGDAAAAWRDGPDVGGCRGGGCRRRLRIGGAGADSGHGRLRRLRRHRRHMGRLRRRRHGRPWGAASAAVHMGGGDMGGMRRRSHGRRRRASAAAAIAEHVRDEAGRRRRHSPRRPAGRFEGLARRSMAEVAAAGEDHGHAVLVAGGDGLVVAPRAAGLDDRGDARGGGDVGAVAEREEGVGGEHRALGLARRPCSTAIRTESSRLIWPAPTPTSWPSLGQHDRVRLHRLADPPGEGQRRALGLGRRRVGSATVPEAGSGSIASQSWTSRPPSTRRRSKPAGGGSIGADRRAEVEQPDAVLPGRLGRQAARGRRRRSRGRRSPR